MQYKNRAFDMFRELLENMRTGVVSRMFTYRPRDLSSVQTSVTASRPEAPALPAAQPAEASPGEVDPVKQGGVTASGRDASPAPERAQASQQGQKPAGTGHQGKSKRHRRRR